MEQLLKSLVERYRELYKLRDSERELRGMRETLARKLIEDRPASVNLLERLDRQSVVTHGHHVNGHPR